MTFTIDPRKHNIEILTTSNSLTKDEINNLKEVSDKFPNYTIVIKNQGGGNSGGGCGCGGKCSSSKLHNLLNKEIFNLKSRVLTLELTRNTITYPTYPTYPYVWYDYSTIPCTISTMTVNKDNDLTKLSKTVPQTNTSNETSSSGVSSSGLSVNDATSTAIFLATTQGSF